MNTIHQLSPTVAYSDAFAVRDPKLLQREKTRSVVSITSAVPQSLPKGVRGVYVYCPDGEPVPAATAGYIIGTIVESASRGNTLVHCWKGRSRSVAFAVAAVAVMEGTPYLQVLENFLREGKIPIPHMQIVQSVNAAVTRILEMLDGRPEVREPVREDAP